MAGLNLFILKNNSMFDHIADFTAWPILTGILIGYIANKLMSGEGKG